MFLPLILSLSLLTPASKAALITEYYIPIDYRPHGIAVSGSDIWFTAQFANKICLLSGSTIYEWNIPTLGSEPYELAVDSEGQVWFTEYQGNKIGRFKNPVFVEFELPGSRPMGIAIDKNVSFPNVWFTEFTGNKIGKIYYNTTGKYWVIVEYTLPTSGSGPMDIAVSPVDGLIWVTLYNNTNKNKIASFNPWTLTFKEYTLPNLPNGPWHPRELIIDDNGFVWFSFDSENLMDYDKIGRLNPWSAEIVFYDIPTQASGPRGLTIDKDGNIWFTEYDKGKIGRLNPVNRYITEFSLSDSSSTPWGITVDPNTKNPPIWFTEWTGNKIGFLDPTTGTTISTVTTITSATTTIATQPTLAKGIINPQSKIIYSTATMAGQLSAKFITVSGTNSTNRYATSTVSVNTETIFVIPTTTTLTTTSFIYHISSTSTTLTATLTTYVSTVSQTTSTTLTTIFYTPIGTETVIVTRGLVLTNIVSTVTVSEFAATSYAFKTTTLPFYISYITSTITELTTLYTTSTLTIVSYTTVTTTIALPLILASIFTTLLIYYRKKNKGNGGK